MNSMYQVDGTLLWTQSVALCGCMKINLYDLQHHNFVSMTLQQQKEVYFSMHERQSPCILYMSCAKL